VEPDGAIDSPGAAHTIVASRQMAIGASGIEMSECLAVQPPGKPET
jgi:hypothetical protein